VEIIGGVGGKEVIGAEIISVGVAEINKDRGVVEII